MSLSIKKNQKEKHAIRSNKNNYQASQKQHRMTSFVYFFLLFSKKLINTFYVFFTLPSNACPFFYYFLKN
jgi:uncharacterized membrane protein